MLRRSAGLFKTKFENAAWGLELQSYGFGDHQTALTGTPAVKADDQRLSYLWDANVQEWFINEPRGLGHGFTVNEHPAAALNAQFSTLNFHLASPCGTLTPAVSAGDDGATAGRSGPAPSKTQNRTVSAPFLHRFSILPGAISSRSRQPAQQPANLPRHDHPPTGSFHELERRCSKPGAAAGDFSN